MGPLPSRKQGEGQLSPTYFGCVDVSPGASIVASHAVVPPAADLSVFIATSSFFPRIDCKFVLTAVARWVETICGYTPQERLLTQGPKFGLGGVRGTCVCGTSFIGLWAAEVVTDGRV